VRTIGKDNVAEFIATIRPLVVEEVMLLVQQPRNGYEREQMPAEQFRGVVDLMGRSAELRALVAWQRAEIATMLVGYRAATGGVRVDYRSPSRFLMLLRRTSALETGDFTRHATRQDIVDQVVSYGASATTARRLIDDTEHAGLVNIVPCDHLCGLGCSQAGAPCGSQKHYVTPTASWMFSHCAKQLTMMLFRYAMYRVDSSDQLAASTFRERWERNFGFRPSTLDAAELVWARVSRPSAKLTGDRAGHAE